MKKTLQDQYLLIKEGKGHKDIFIKEAKRQFPGLIRNSATYTEVANVLKTKNLINENVVGLEPINQLQPSKKESFEVAFENFLAEAKKEHFDDEKAELKKTSKQVEEDAEKNFDYEDKKNPDNLIFDQIMKGYYTEMKDPKNENKTMEQLKAIVIKNLEKNPTYYTEKGQFGVKDLGYTMDAPGLGEPKEPKGKYKSSGYGNLNEGIESHSFKVGDKVRFDGSIATIVNIGGGYAQLDWNDEFIEVSVKRLKPIQESINEGIKETIKRLFKAAKKKLGMSNIVQATDEEFEYARDYGLKKYPGYSMSGIGVDQIQDIIHVAYMDVDSEDGDEVEIELPIPKNLNEETQIRKVVRSIINEELEEGYDDIFEDKDDDGFDEIWEKFKKDLRKRMGQPESPKNESLNESKIRTVIRENVHKELAEINKLAEYEVYESKLAKINELIEKKSSFLERINEDEAMKALTDKKKVKELQKEVKILERAKAKIEKALAKEAKKMKSIPKKEVIDEDEPISEVASEDAEATSAAASETADELERAATAAKELDDALEEDMEAPADYLVAKEDAEARYDAGEELDSILSDYPKHRNTLERDILGKFDGMDY